MAGAGAAAAPAPGANRRDEACGGAAEGEASAREREGSAGRRGSAPLLGFVGGNPRSYVFSFEVCLGVS